MAAGSVAWVSLDPVNCRIDIYPQHKAAEVERAYAAGEGSIFLGARSATHPWSALLSQA